jgi:hypothetical protein
MFYLDVPDKTGLAYAFSGTRQWEATSAWLRTSAMISLLCHTFPHTWAVGIEEATFRDLSEFYSANKAELMSLELRPVVTRIVA